MDMDFYNAMNQINARLGDIIVLKEVFSGVLLETTEGNQIAVCARDDTFEINILPKGFKGHCWQRVNVQAREIVAEDNEAVQRTQKAELW